MTVLRLTCSAQAISLMDLPPCEFIYDPLTNAKQATIRIMTPWPMLSLAAIVLDHVHVNS
jgi:hypothetical protein